MEALLASGRPVPPGVLFHPTDEQLVMHYLRQKALGMPLEPEFIVELDIYQYHPEGLRERAYFKEELTWYFFCARKRKYGRGDRQKRATGSGFWKPTGEPKPVRYKNQIVGEVQTLVFYQGKAKKGEKGERTNWVMHEYKLQRNAFANMPVSEDDYVICKIFKKGGLGPRNGEQYGAPYIIENWDNAHVIPVTAERQCTSVLSNPAIINGSEYVDAHPVHTSEQVNSVVVSLSAVDQAASPSANIASTLMAADQVHNPMSKDDDIGSILNEFWVDYGQDNNLEGIGLNDLEYNMPDGFCADYGRYDNREGISLNDLEDNGFYAD